ncbi:MAG: hypothetical protein J6Y02_17965 [Pseudobutyrivibrio sp.]|nr:hypothetical protein [Pseudobutyrivibrio sp.]
MKTYILSKYKLTCSARDIRIIIAGLKLHISKLSPEDHEEEREYTGNMLFDLEELIGERHGK